MSPTGRCVFRYAIILLTGVGVLSPTDVRASFGRSDQTVCRPGWHGEIQGVPGGRSVLYDIDASGTAEAWAVGAYYNGKGVVEHFRDGLWWWGTLPRMGAGLDTITVLRGVSALQAGVWAVGSVSSGDQRPKPLIAYRTGGKWTSETAPGGVTAGVVEDVSMMSADTGWAVGWRSGPHGARPVAFRYLKDTGWTTSSQGLEGVRGRLLSIDTLPDGRAWAVGNRKAGGELHALRGYWNGTRWLIQRRQGSASSLSDVSMLEPSDGWAVGWILPSDGHIRLPLAEHWNGSQWERVGANSPGRGPSEFRAVSADADTGVWGVGGFRWRGQPRPLIEAWDGRRFVSYPSATDPTIPDTMFLGAGAVDRRAVAVGRQGPILGAAASCPLTVNPDFRSSLFVNQGDTVPVLWNSIRPSRVVDAVSGGSLIRTNRMSSGDISLLRFWSAGSYPLVTKRKSGMRLVVNVPVEVDPQIGSSETTFDIRWAPRRPVAGFVFDVQVSIADGPFRSWLRGTARAASRFTYSPSEEEGWTTIRFRARMRIDGGTTAWLFSLPARIRVHP